MSCQVFQDKTDARGADKLPGSEIDPHLRVYDISGGVHKTKFPRKSSNGTVRMVWKCCGQTNKGNKCRFVDFSSNHLIKHIKQHHNPRKENKEKRSVPKNKRKIKTTRTILRKELSDQKWKYQDSYVSESLRAQVDVYGGIKEDLFYEESVMSQASTTDTTPNKNDSILGLYPSVLESALEQIDENFFVQSLFAE